MDIAEKLKEIGTRAFPCGAVLGLGLAIFIIGLFLWIGGFPALGVFLMFIGLMIAAF